MVVNVHIDPERRKWTMNGRDLKEAREGYNSHKRTKDTTRGRKVHGEGEEERKINKIIFVKIKSIHLYTFRK